VSNRVQAAEETPFVIKRLHEAGVVIRPRSYLSEIGDNTVTGFDVHTDESFTITGVSAVVLATGRNPVNDLEAELEGRVKQLYVIGDAAAARMWGAATFEALYFAHMIGEPGSPATLSQSYFANR